MIDRRLAAAGAVGEHTMSMLQDLQRGQSMEIDALVTAMQELGQLAGIPTPTIDLLLTLVRERGKQAGLDSSLLKRVR
jgi:2-dehydropantoate 2-reductase